MIIERLKDELDVLVSLDFKKVNEQQRQILKDEYNFHTVGFEYSQDDWGNIVFICGNDTFRKMEYYVGLEYEREMIEYKFEINNKIAVSYSDSERAEKLYQSLINNE